MVTDIKLPPDTPRKQFEREAKEYLGTKIQLNIFDDIAIFYFLEDKDEKFLLYKDNEDRFSYRKDYENGFSYIILQLNKTDGVITSINFTVNKGGGDSTITAKLE